MLQLNDNAYNKMTAPDEPKLKLWTSMGLLLTYQCPAECEFCYYNCNPQKSGLLSIENAVNAWQQLKNIAGEHAKIHLTGGEPFLQWPHLQQLLSKAKAMSMGPVDVIETNAYWAEEQKDIIERLRFLDDHNVSRLKISYDPFHAEFVDFSRIKLLYTTACDLLGHDRVMLRWQKYFEQSPQIKGLSEEQKLDVFLQSHKQYPFRFTGKAAGKLAKKAADKQTDQIAEENCKKAFLGSKSVHIDPFGNIFNGVCSGIVIGNINENPLDVLWQKFNPAKEEFLDVLFKKGPAGFLKKATKLGYKKYRLYAGKCHLCTDLRRFFFDKGLFGPIIGPKECYI
ncbi:MAG: 4Fe-4S cluster-binding domain-containing protein [Sedimentisphaerales bacterium]|nr:4Fe-4S cluster-binding domain-containing protein [Sedimentisphaerales bacterium]